MHYVVFAAIVLCIATALLSLQYRRTKGTPEHAQRGWTIFVCALAALGAIEYALWSEAIHLERNLPLLILHLFFALPMLIMLCATVASGAVAHSKQTRMPERFQLYKSMRIHAFAAKNFPWMWAATIITGLLFFFTSLKR